MQTYSHVALTAAAVMPPVFAMVLVYFNRRTLKQIEKRLEEMRQVEAGMREMLAAPAKLRRMSHEIRDSITRIQEEKP